MPAVSPWIRSALITFFTTLALAITATGFEYTKPALVAAGVTAARTAVAALLPGGPFGVGSGPK